MNKVPVLVIAFNRPNHLKRAFATVKEYQPDKLYLACDGPRDNVVEEPDLVAASQKVMLESVDWQCEVRTLFREKNLGCTMSEYEAMTWFFENEEYGVIVEDDVLVSLDFFKLSEILLPYYEKEQSIMMISAQNKTSKQDVSNGLLFGTYTYIWGWATWRRAWKKMDMKMEAWPKCDKWKLLFTYGPFAGIFIYRGFKAGYHSISAGSWDRRWAFAVFYHNGLVLMPKVNLAKNIGIGDADSANYQKGDVDPYVNQKMGHVNFPLVFPKTLSIDRRQLFDNQLDYLRQRYIGLKKRIRRLF